MKKIKLLACLLGSIIIVSCDTRKDYMDKFNTVPDFGIKKKGIGGGYETIMADSAWIPAAEYTLDYRVIDNVNDIETFDLVSNIGTGTMSLNESAKQMTITNYSNGKNAYAITCTDKFGAKKTCSLDLYGLNNRTPDANLFVIQTNSVSAREIKVSGINSIDVDFPYGDHLIEYQYKIGPSYNSTTCYTVNTPLSSINYIAATTGTVMVYMKVKDSQGSISTLDSLKFTIN